MWSSALLPASMLVTMQVFAYGQTGSGKTFVMGTDRQVCPASKRLKSLQHTPSIGRVLQLKI